MQIFIFLHIVTMFTAVTMGYGPAVLMVTANRARDVPALRGIMRASYRMERLIGPTFILGAVLGLVAAYTNGYDLLAGWLVIAYFLFVVAAITPVVLTGPWLRKVAAAADASADDAPSPELTRLLTAPRYVLAVLFDVGIIVLFIADMVFKPLPDKLL